MRLDGPAIRKCRHVDGMVAEERFILVPQAGHRLPSRYGPRAGGEARNDSRVSASSDSASKRGSRHTARAVRQFLRRQRVAITVGRGGRNASRPSFATHPTVDSQPIIANRRSTSFRLAARIDSHSAPAYRPAQ
jgi:hypothetical protein